MLFRELLSKKTNLFLGKGNEFQLKQTENQYCLILDLKLITIVFLQSFKVKSYEKCNVIKKSYIFSNF
jgi:hypothetical protein